MNQVAEKKNNALATFDMEADAQQGTQNISQEDLALPFLKILGQLSPEVNKRDGKYVEGAEPGKIINTVTNELFDKISVVPCHYKRQYIEWQDRGTSTGAPVAIHDADSDIVSQTTRGKDYKDRLPNGNYLDNTASHFVLTLGDNPQTALISMKSTQLKISRKWNSMMMSLRQKRKDGKGFFRPAPFTQQYTLKTVLEKNNLGSWYGWEIEHTGTVGSEDTIKAAFEFYESCKKGAVRVNHGKEEQVEKTPF